MPDRIISLPGGRRIFYDRLSVVERADVDRELVEFDALVERNPLMGFDPFAPQKLFLAAGRVKTKMAVAGNRAGKTEIGVVDDLIQCVDAGVLPEWLRSFKCWDPPFKLRVVTMDLNATLFGVMIPKWEGLTPRGELVGGSWEKAFDKTQRLLRFRNGSSVQFMSADQDREKHSGASLDRVHFDEEPPPPNGYGIYAENRRRLIDRAGQLMFTMTPLLGLSWTYDEIWLRRDEPSVVCVKWSMLDNPYLPSAEVQAEIAATRSEKERQAVINGDFTHFRGRVLEEFDEARHVVDPPSREQLAQWDVVIAYDPGLQRSGVVWVAFDQDNEMLVFDELYVQGVPLVYMELRSDGSMVSRSHRPGDGEVPSILERAAAKNAWWGVRPLVWIVDPQMRTRETVGARESVQSMLLRAGVSAIPGENDRLSGIMELKARLVGGALRVSRNCVSWLREADRWLVANDEEANEMRARGTAKGHVFTTIGPDHLMDPTRYAALFRVWAGRAATRVVESPATFRPGRAIPGRYLTPATETPPMGSMS